MKSDFLLCTSFFFILQYCFTLFCFVAHYSHVRMHEIHKLILWKFTHNNLLLRFLLLADTLLLFSIVNEVIAYRTLPWAPGLGGFSYRTLPHVNSPLAMSFDGEVHMHNIIKRVYMYSLVPRPLPPPVFDHLPGNKAIHVNAKIIVSITVYLYKGICC